MGWAFRPGTVSYELVEEIKLPLLLKAFQNFRRVATAATRQAFTAFCQARTHWLDDYALFMALKAVHRGMAWNTWEPGLVQRQPEDAEAVEKQASQRD